jgi:ABC-type transporter Mla MlaB component
MAAATELNPLRFSSEEDLEVCVSGLMAGHSVAADGGALLITWTASRAAIAVSGEADERACSTLAETLKRLTAGLELVHVYLAGLEYCDLAGLRVIVSLAATGDHCRQVVLHEVPPQLMAVMCILGWDAMPGLVLHERSEGRLLRPAGSIQMHPAAGPGSAGWPAPGRRHGRPVIWIWRVLVPRFTKAGI